MMLSTSRGMVAVLVAGVGILTGQLANADLPGSLTNPVEITDVSASEGEAGGVSRVGFTLANTGGEVLTLMAVRSGVAKHARFVARTDSNATVVLPALGISGGQSADGNTSHLWIELCPLTQVLEAGDTFPLTMVFSSGEIEVDVHVHTGTAPVSDRC